MTESEFWMSTPRYLEARRKAHAETVYLGWEQARFVAFFVLKTVDSKRKIKRFTDVCKFPWERATQPQFVKQSIEQLKQFDAEADLILKQTQPEAYARYMAAREAALKAKEDGQSSV
jgi:hypothetical protein